MSPSLLNCFFRAFFSSYAAMEPSNNIVMNPMAFPTDQSFAVSQTMDTSSIENDNLEGPLARKPWLKRPGAAIGECFPSLISFFDDCLNFWISIHI